MLLLLKAMFLLYAKNFEGAAQRNTFNEILSAQTKKCLIPNKRKYECGKSEINSDYAMMEPIVMM